MRRKSPSFIPRYSRHPQKPDAGLAVWLDKSTGRPRRQTLPGAFNSPESRLAFEELRVQIRTSNGGKPRRREALTIPELLNRYILWAEGYYRFPNGRETSTMAHVRIVARAICGLAPNLAAAEFGPLRLKSAIAQSIRDGCSRVEINRRIGRVKAVFKWGTSEELVPVSVYHGLLTVPGLRAGRSSAPELPAVEPVAQWLIDATLPRLNSVIASMVRFQLLTGARPGEVCDSPAGRCGHGWRGLALPAALPQEQPPRSGTDHCHRPTRAGTVAADRSAGTHGIRVQPRRCGRAGSPPAIGRAEDTTLCVSPAS